MNRNHPFRPRSIAALLGLLLSLLLFLPACAVRKGVEVPTASDSAADLAVVTRETLTQFAEAGLRVRSARFSAAGLTRIDLDTNGYLALTFIDLSPAGLDGIGRLRTNLFVHLAEVRSTGARVRSVSAVEEPKNTVQPSVCFGKGHLQLITLQP